ncbi:UvrB/UvrC motif-containing protein [Bacillus sp. FJAT-27445]|uniref:UvrB/UvrC motif-containing protein n=1 Tax=Bacillus sp. FJAT-27445 TaxID=1679166 RepID=UPI000743687E|nr:UvrB/UvrC motif-containing protein [Bacillus sp. FJAT-27445]
MICDECKQKPATMHFTKILNGQKTEFHLCEHCAREKGDMFMMNGGAGFSINNLLAGLLNFDNTYQQSGQDAFKKEEVQQCPECKMTFPQFVKLGRFGCANCYSAFSSSLQPILKRLHGGNWKHNGKIPKRVGGTIHIRKKLEETKRLLKELISREEFEKAAEIRDEIRALEHLMKGSAGGGK